MPIEHIFDEKDVQELINQNASKPFGSRNAALILGGVYWGLTPLEMCWVTVEDIVAPNGQLYKEWVLPAQAAYNGVAREIHTADHVLPFFESYVEMRLEQSWGVSNLHAYRGLSPDSYFFLNDSGKQYQPTKRKSSPNSYQPRSMIEQLKRMIARTGIQGATASTYRDSFIKTMHDSGAGWKDLMRVSGIKQKRTLERKVRPHERELEAVLSRLYSRVKMPNSTK